MEGMRPGFLTMYYLDEITSDAAMSPLVGHLSEKSDTYGHKVFWISAYGEKLQT